MRAKMCIGVLVAVVAVFALVERASAFGGAGVLAPLAHAAPDSAMPASWCGYKCGRPITPQYFRYRPPSLAARCFHSRYGDVYCPYAERPAWWRGCWMGRDGRKVCQNPGLFW